MEEELKKILSVINSSGFLLQLGLNYQIRSTRLNEEHDYDVLVIEHPWQNGNSGEEGFIDIILKAGITRLVVECKRPKDGEWVFLVNDKANDNISRGRGLWAYSFKDKDGISAVDEFAISPVSFQSSICLIRGQGEDKLSLLERLAGQLLKAVESIAVEELEISQNKNYHEPMVYFPIIVTTADLKVAKIAEANISMKNGSINHTEFTSVPFIRFRKSLVNTLSPNSKPTDLIETSKDKERTVFVVNSEHIITFLKYFSVDPFGSYPWNRKINNIA